MLFLLDTVHIVIGVRWLNIELNFLLEHSFKNVILSPSVKAHTSKHIQYAERNVQKQHAGPKY